MSEQTSDVVRLTDAVEHVLGRHTLSWEGGHFECSCGWRDLTAGPFFAHQAVQVAEITTAVFFIIDPDDRAQVERVLAAFDSERAASDRLMGGNVELMQAALRSLRESHYPLGQTDPKEAGRG